MSIDFQAIVFVIMSALAILGALGCVFSRRVAHSLLSLMLTFFAVAGVFAGRIRGGIPAIAFVLHI